MSLTSFLSIRDVRAKLKPLRPNLPRKIAAPLKVEPRSNRHSMVGTAFDYLLRLELQRRAPHSVARPWVAEQVPDRIYREPRPSRVPGFEVCVGGYIRPREQGRLRKIVEEAKSAVAIYAKLNRPNRGSQAELAAHAIHLAHLDAVYRGALLDPAFEVAHPEDVEDLLRLLAIVPFDSLIHNTRLLLNPDFGDSSNLVGGADADLITGDMLVDFKTLKAGDMKGEHLDQLLGYCLLARRHRQVNPAFPEIKRLTLYFCRHGYLWTMDATTWTDHPQFAEVEKWFFKRAKEVCRNPVIS